MAVFFVAMAAGLASRKAGRFDLDACCGKSPFCALRCFLTAAAARRSDGRSAALLVEVCPRH